MARSPNRPSGGWRELKVSTTGFESPIRSTCAPKSPWVQPAVAPPSAPCRRRGAEGGATAGWTHGLLGAHVDLIGDSKPVVETLSSRQPPEGLLGLRAIRSAEDNWEPTHVDCDR